MSKKAKSAKTTRTATAKQPAPTVPTDAVCCPGSRADFKPWSPWQDCLFPVGDLFNKFSLHEFSDAAISSQRFDGILREAGFNGCMGYIGLYDSRPEADSMYKRVEEFLNDLREWESKARASKATGGEYDFLRSQAVEIGTYLKRYGCRLQVAARATPGPGTTITPDGTVYLADTPSDATDVRINDPAAGQQNHELDDVHRALLKELKKLSRKPPVSRVSRKSLRANVVKKARSSNSTVDRRLNQLATWDYVTLPGNRGSGRGCKVTRAGEAALVASGK